MTKAHSCVQGGRRGFKPGQYVHILTAYFPFFEKKFFFIEKTFKKWKIYSRNVYVLTRFEPPKTFL